MSLRTFVRICDSISDRVGRAFAWVAVPIAALVLYEVISRRIFNNPHLWALDTATLLYAIHFMMVGAYGLLHNSHVNIDTIYVYLPPMASRSRFSRVSLPVLPLFFYLSVRGNGPGR
jgi:TRAP-type mannitol/chloroaromatic compound transport system permease small subunit